MRTRRSLKPKDPLLVGRLSIEIPWSRAKPWIAIEIWCPHCKVTHQHGWDERMNRSDAVTHRVAHCHDQEAGRRVLEDYWIGMDPSHREHNRSVLAEFPKALKRWEARQARR